jgi:hypothetical protein
MMGIGLVVLAHKNEGHKGWLTFAALLWPLFLFACGFIGVVILITSIRIKMEWP